MAIKRHSKVLLMRFLFKFVFRVYFWASRTSRNDIISTCKKLLSAGMISEFSTITNCPYANNQSNGDRMENE